jgi:RNA polymerase sigma-70 factor (ECF subfamily)
VNGRRRVSSWAARGPLEAWLRTIVVRQGLRVRRAQVQFSSRLEAAVQTSPELLVMKAQLRELFAAALREAMASLEGPQRALLHRYYVDRLTIDELAEEHRVHRATAARWVAAAQRTLLSDVRRLLLARHQLGRSALNSAIRLVRSELGVSWSRLEPG